MRNRYLEVGKKAKVALESDEEIKVDAPKENEDSRPQEPATADNATGTGSGGSEAVNVDAPKENEDTRPVDDAIESSEEGEIEEGESTLEFDIAKVNEETSAAAGDYFEVQSNVEVLESYAVQLRHLIKTNTCTPQTARILKTAINNQLRNVSMEAESVSLEAMTTPLSVKQQHQKLLDTVALEGVLSRQVSQSVVVGFKHNLNATADFFRGVGGKVKKYEAKLEAGHKEFLDAKPKFKTDKHIGYLTELWYHFSTEQGPVKNIIGALEHDIGLTQYVLNTYAPAVMDLAVVITNICKSGDLSTPEGILKVGEAFARLKHPGDMFDDKYIKGQSYLSVTHLDIEKGKGRQVIDVNGKSLEKLAYLASPKKVVEVGSSKHTMKKIAGYITQATATAVPVPGTSIATKAIAGKIAGSFMMTTAEIEKVFVYGKHYLEIVKHFLANEDKLEQVGGNMDEAINKLASTAKDATGKKVANQIRDFSFATLMYNYNSPARDEVARAIKGAKYCGYLGHRMIYNGKRTTKGQVHE